MKRRWMAIVGLVAMTAAAAQGAVVINEVLGSTTGTDSEFIELYNSGPSAVDISGWKIELWDSDAGAAYGLADAGSPYIIPASTSIAAGGYYLMANTTYSTYYSATPNQVIPENGIENSSYTIILVDATDVPQNSVFVTDGGVGDAANRAGVSITPDATVGPDGSFLPAGFYRVGDGSNTLQLLEYSPQPAPSATPGATNPSIEPPMYILTTTGASATTIQLPIEAGNYSVTALTAQYPTLAVSGTLTDPNNSNADVTTGGALNGSTVDFTPANSGLYSFSYSITSGKSGTVYVGVQSGDVIMTEIMYRPANYPYGDWEWVEVKNNGGSEVFLNSLMDVDVNQYDNLDGLSIPAGATRVILVDTVAASWLTEWNDGDRPAANMTTGDLLQIYAGSGFIKPEFGDDDTLFLFDASGGLLDAISYTDGENGWPAYNNKGSMFLAAGAYTAAGNDLSSNWALSLASANNTYATPEDFGGYADSDAGSPMLAPGGPTVTPPQIDNGWYTVNNDGAAYAITLAATPAAPVPTFSVVSALSAVAPTTTVAGTLTDPNNGNMNVTSGGSLAGSVVNFTPAGSGIYQFRVQADDGTSLSNKATITLYVQQAGSVVITEIMYDPDNINAGTTISTNDWDWEWVEVYNPTGSPVALHTLTDTFDYAYGNLVGCTVPAGGVMILAPDSNASRTQAQFLTEWAPLAAGQVCWIADPANDWRRLSSGTDTIRLLSATGEVLDAVTYDVTAPWPTDTGYASIYLHFGSLDSFSNDDGANWSYSAAGYEGAYQSDATAQSYSNTTDVGSPGVLGTGAPVVSGLSLKVNEDVGTRNIFFTAFDPNNPETLTFSIVDGLTAMSPTTSIGGCTLVDPLGPTDVTAGSASLGGDNVDLNIPNGFSGVLMFTYTATDGDNNTANPATVFVYVQGQDRVVITEIMYDTANQADNDWEWVEVKNVSGSAVNLHSLFTTSHTTPRTNNNLANVSLAPGEVAIIVPDDNASRTVTEFLTEWAPPYPQGTTIVVATPATNWSNLSNSGSTVVLMGTDGSVLDVVGYSNGTSGWPAVAFPGSTSIYLRTDLLGSFANDDGGSWLTSVAGVHNAYATPEAPGTPTDSDVGSPWIVSDAPIALDQGYVAYNIGGANLITLDAVDPSATSMNLAIVNGGIAPVTPTPALAGITLTDPNNGDADVTAGGALGGNTVNLNVPTNVSGLFAFDFQAASGAGTSNTAVVTVYVQSGSIMMTEIMYDSANQDDSDWEWVEITNLTGSPVTLGTLGDAGFVGVDNLTGLTVPANGTLILAPGDVNGDTSSRTGSAFLAEWSISSGGVFWVPESTWPFLNNDGETVMLFDSAGGLLDVVSYKDDGVVWPQVPSPGSQSIYVTCGNYTAAANDTGANWALSADGVDGAYTTPEDPGLPTDSDVGSPGVLPVCQFTEIVATHVFYNNSYYDGNSAALNAGDNAAIDPDKALLVSGPSSFANYTGFTKGINGLMFDIADAETTPVQGDFTFQRMGYNANTPGATVAPSALAIVVGGGVNGSDRVKVAFADGEIVKTWLKITVGTDFGLTDPAVFWFGNQVGECNSPASGRALVNATDFNDAKNPINAHGPFNRAPVDDWYDVDKDSLVNATDLNQIRANFSGPFNSIYTPISK